MKVLINTLQQCPNLKYKNFLVTKCNLVTHLVRIGTIIRLQKSFKTLQYFACNYFSGLCVILPTSGISLTCNNFSFSRPPRYFQPSVI